MLTAEQVMSLSLLASQYDERKPPADDNAKRMLIDTWLDAVGEFSFEDCCEAIRTHYKTSTDRLMHKHVIDGVKRIRAERLRLYGPIPPPEHLNQVHEPMSVAWSIAYDRYMRETGDAIKAGELLPGQLPPDLARAALPPAKPRDMTELLDGKAAWRAARDQIKQNNSKSA